MENCGLIHVKDDCLLAIDGDWWQTNGADGLAYVRDTTNPPGTDDILPRSVLVQ